MEKGWIIIEDAPETVALAAKRWADDENIFRTDEDASSGKRKQRRNTG